MKGRGLTVLVSENLVEVNLGLVPLALDVGEHGLERRPVELNILGAVVEGHGCCTDENWGMFFRYKRAMIW